MAPGLRYCATLESKFRLISRFSATTSMIQSASAQRARSPSKFPIEIFSASEELKNAAGRDFFAASIPLRAKRFRSEAGAPGLRSGGTMSSSTQGSPALAKCAAMRAPMVPAPKTTAFCMGSFMGRFRMRYGRLDRLQDLYLQTRSLRGYKTSKARSNRSAESAQSNRIEG